jgi:hypothetical protein
MKSSSRNRPARTVIPRCLPATTSDVERHAEMPHPAESRAPGAGTSVAEVAAMAHLRIIALSILIAATGAGCAAPLLSPPLRYSASFTTSVSTHEPEDEDHEEAEADDDHEAREERVMVRKRSCNPCRRRVYVTPYYYYYPYIQVY